MILRVGCFLHVALSEKNHSMHCLIIILAIRHASQSAHGLEGGGKVQEEVSPLEAWNSDPNLGSIARWVGLVVNLNHQILFGVEKPCLAVVPKNRTTAEFLQDFHSKQLHHNCCWQVHFSQHVIYPLFSDGTSVDETVRWLLAVVGCVLRDKRGTIILWKCRPTSLLGASYLWDLG